MKAWPLAKQGACFTVSLFAINFHFLQFGVFRLKKLLLKTHLFKAEVFIKSWRITNRAKN